MRWKRFTLRLLKNQLALQGAGECNTLPKTTIHSQLTTSKFLVVGSGLAACLMAWQLRRAGQSVHLIGDTAAPSASRAAAGIINPVTGRWMTKSWRFEHFFPCALDTYAQLERSLNLSIYHPVPVRRFFQNAEDAKRAGRRSRNPRYGEVLGKLLAPGERPLPLLDAAGSIEIRQGGWVDLPKLTEGIRTRLAASAAFSDQPFVYADLKRDRQNWRYRNHAFDAVVFCEGVGLRHNPWFNRLELAPIKGETLELQSPSLKLDPGIFHRRKWLLAYGSGHFRLGATYDENDPSAEPTPKGRQELLDDALALLPEDLPFHITRHLAGLRPATADTRPLLGAHPSEPGLYLLNGLGSKGASSAPWLSQHLTRHILRQSPVDPEVDLRRAL